MLEVAAWLRWTILVLVTLIVCLVAFSLAARAVGGWGELARRQFSYGVPMRYFAPILPVIVVATLLLDPTDDLDGTEWVPIVVRLTLLCAVGIPLFLSLRSRAQRRRERGAP